MEGRDFYVWEWLQRVKRNNERGYYNGPTEAVLVWLVEDALARKAEKLNRDDPKPSEGL